MRTYQDLIEIEEKGENLLDFVHLTIWQHRGSNIFRTAQTAAEDESADAERAERESLAADRHKLDIVIWILAIVIAWIFLIG